MGVQSDQYFARAYRFIEECNIHEAGDLLKEALTADLHNDELVFAIKCCNFWQNALDSNPNLSYYEQGENLINHWKDFLTLEDTNLPEHEKTVYCFNKGIFSLAYKYYSEACDENDSKLKSELNRKKGLCLKKLGSYELALDCLTEANSAYQNQASILAEMADCYALCGETKNAKILFKEAFFLDAQKIDLVFLDSELIKVLINKVKEKGFSGAVLQEWIPVYGVIFGVFNIKRKLRSQEILNLKQEIYSKEYDVKNPSKDHSVIIPRLINLYFRLIEHLILSEESISKVNETMLKIKILDPAIFDLYAN